MLQSVYNVFSPSLRENRWYFATLARCGFIFLKLVRRSSKSPDRSSFCKVSTFPSIAELVCSRSVVYELFCRWSNFSRGDSASFGKKRRKSPIFVGTCSVPPVAPVPVEHGPSTHRSHQGIGYPKCCNTHQWFLSLWGNIQKGPNKNPRASSSRNDQF